MSVKRLLRVPALCLLVSVAAAPGLALAGGEYVGERNSFNRFHGQGVYTYTNGSVYEGQWVDGRKQGKGKQVQPDGSVYEGDWLDNMQHGRGSMRWANGDRYEGQWSAGRMHGSGVFVAANGDRYEGGFVNDRREGKGKLVSKNGEQFSGQWKAGKRQGEGSLRKADGSQVVATWSDDRLGGSATVTFANGDRFVGALRNELPHGKGVCKKGGESTPCEYRDGQLQVAQAPVAPAVPAPAVAVPPVVPAKAAVVAAAASATVGQQPVVKVPGAAPASSDQAAAFFIEKQLRTTEKPVTSADRNRRTAAVMAINDAPPAAGIPPVSVAPKPDAQKFSFLHDWNGVPTRSNAAMMGYAEKDAFTAGDIRIRAEGTDMNVTLVVDEYTGPGVYPLQYFKASITREGVASFQTAAAEPGEIHITHDDGKVISGTFRFAGYRNGNPATQDKRSVTDGVFVVPVRPAAK